MISDGRIFELVEKIVKNKNLPSLSGTELMDMVDEPYTIYLLKNKETRKPEDKFPPIRLGRMLVTADGQHWIGLLEKWVREDNIGKQIEEVYSAIYQDIAERAASAKRKEKI